MEILDSKIRLGEMVYIFVSDDGKIVLPFQGTEQEMENYWEILEKNGLSIDRIEHQLIQTADRNPYTYY